MAEKELLLSVQDLKKQFGEREILKGISFDVNKGDVVCIIGPSGSGKSTLIRCVNFLEQPTDGVIAYRGKNVLETFKNLPLYRTTCRCTVLKLVWCSSSLICSTI